MTRLLEIDVPKFEDSFAERSMGVTHGLCGHEELSVEAVADLADALPASSVEHNRSDVAAVLKNIEHQPVYRRLLDELLDEVVPLVKGDEGGMNLREGFIFLSAPNSATPAHTDHEHNFLLQVRSPKRMYVGSFRDPLAEQLQIERMYAGHRNMDQLPDDPILYDLSPGEGVYVPPCAPHYVQTLARSRSRSPSPSARRSPRGPPTCTRSIAT